MIQSEEFPPYDIQKEFWTLRLYPKGYQRLSTDDNSTIQFYLTLCPSHVSSSQIQIYFRALINFSNRQVRTQDDHSNNRIPIEIRPDSTKIL
jgi:hypothetical protein